MVTIEIKSRDRKGIIDFPSLARDLECVAVMDFIDGCFPGEGEGWQQDQAKKDYAWAIEER